MKRLQCSMCLGIVGIDIMPDEFTPEGICSECFMEREEQHTHDTLAEQRGDR